MTDTTSSSTTSAQTAAAPAAQNYILYRTAALMYQPGYGYNAGDTPVVPAAQVSTAAGTVIATQQLTGLTGMTAPDGLYPIGSAYTPAFTS